MIYLDDPVLGQLDLDCGDGYVVSSFTIGWPAERPVVRSRALTDGVIDTTTYVGNRAVTVALRLDNTGCGGHATQDLLDAVTPYLSPRRRPRVVWSVDKTPSSPLHVRSLEVRGVDAPFTVDAPKALTLVCQWVATESFSRALDETCAVANITGAGELGRPYDLTFDRAYPFSPPFGVTQFTPNGNAPMTWTGTVTSEVTDPELLINGTLITFTGLTLAAGQTLDIDTGARTMLRNNDPADSVYALSNFQDWAWDDLLLQPGLNEIRLEAASYVGNPSFTLCWYDRWHL